MSTATLHRMPWATLEERDLNLLLTREWLVANGLGGYASGTIRGACTRRFHGILIAALPAPWGRFMAVHHLAETWRTPDGTIVEVGRTEQTNPPADDREDPLSEFQLQSGLPVWHYTIGASGVNKRLVMPHMQNTTHLLYRLSDDSAPIRCQLRPAFQFRAHEGAVEPRSDQACPIRLERDRLEILNEHAPAIRMRIAGTKASFVHDGGRSDPVEYEIERARGYDCQGTMWSPGYFDFELEPGQSVALTASTEGWEELLAVEPEAAWDAELARRANLLRQAHPAAQQGAAAQLVLATDQFIIRPQTRVSDSAIAHAAGDHARTVIAGYHWFTDWGRDTMISLEGLTLATGRYDDAGYLLRTFARYVADGLIPNHFPEGSTEPVYHTADASLWYFHALARYLAATHDRTTLGAVLPALQQIVERHQSGTRFGIHVDPHDDLLVQGEEGYQLTWMDAKVEGWVVTPRRGKAVEINALWHNALCWLASWLSEEGDASAAKALMERAEQCRQSFNQRFWNADRNCLFDVVDGPHGDDPAVRPNQLFAISLDHPVLAPERWKPVTQYVAQELLTPYGLRTLSRDHPDYRGTYDGDLRARDAAYHQGTVWPWLIGHYIDAVVKAEPERASEIEALLQPLIEHLGEAGLGSISEIFDAEPPYFPRGCIAQAWSVAEVVRSLVRHHANLR